MGGTLEGGWMEEGGKEGEGGEGGATEQGRGGSSDPFQWEEGSTGSRDSSVFQVTIIIIIGAILNNISVKNIFTELGRRELKQPGPGQVDVHHASDHAGGQCQEGAPRYQV